MWQIKKKEQKDEHVPVPAFKEFTRSWATITIISLDFYSFQKNVPNYFLIWKAGQMATLGDLEEYLPCLFW